MGYRHMGIEESKQVFYIEGMKYQLTQDFTACTNIFFEPEKGIIKMRHIKLFPDGKLLIKAGFTWDGPSGLTCDTKSSMRGSLVHDALYMLIRNGKIPGIYRDEADYILNRLCLEDGMWKWRAWAWLRLVQKFAGFAASKDSIRKVKVAP